MNKEIDTERIFSETPFDREDGACETPGSCLISGRCMKANTLGTEIGYEVAGRNGNALCSQLAGRICEHPQAVAMARLGESVLNGKE